MTRSPSDIWQTVAVCQTWHQPKAYWHTRLADHFAAIQPFLQASPGTLSPTYPSPDTGEALVVRPLPSGGFKAIPPPDDLYAEEPILGLTAEDLCPYTLDLPRLELAIAAALELEGPPQRCTTETPTLSRLGNIPYLAGEPPLYALWTHTAEALRLALAHVACLESSPFALLAPAHAPPAGVNTAPHGRPVAFSRLLRLVFPGGVLATTNAKARLANAIRTTARTDPLKHSPDYHSLVVRDVQYRLRGKAAIIIESLHRAWREGHAGCSKRELLDDIYGINTPAEPRVQNFFREGDAKQLWDNYIRNDRRGNYWLDFGLKPSAPSPRR